MEELKHWKATLEERNIGEFRQFLLYTGPVDLKGVINDNIYIHFLAFSVAISIFLNKHKIKDPTNIAYAKDLLIFFVQKAPEFYGKKFLVYNVHNLIHLHQDVEYFGETLDAYSCFPFENHLQVLKQYVRNSRNPISEIVKKTSSKLVLVISGVFVLYQLHSKTVDLYMTVVIMLKLLILVKKEYHVICTRNIQQKNFMKNLASQNFLGLFILGEVHHSQTFFL